MLCPTDFALYDTLVINGVHLFDHQWYILRRFSSVEVQPLNDTHPYPSACNRRSAFESLGPANVHLFRDFCIWMNEKWNITVGLRLTSLHIDDHWCYF